MSKRKRTPSKGDAFKQAEHRAYMDALAAGQRPARAVTFTNRKKKADKEACRKFRYAL